MGSTNKTANYELSQFIGTDKPAWLQDYNGDMSKIDAGIYASQVAANAAATAANAAQGDATSALTNIGTLTNTVSGLSTDLGTAQSAINTMSALIGNGTPTTTDQTLIGAINELHADIQNAYAYLGTQRVYVTADGVKTNKQVMKDLADACVAYFNTLAEGAMVKTRRASCGGSPLIPKWHTTHNRESTSFVCYAIIEKISSGNCTLRDATISSTLNDNSYYEYFLRTTGNTYTDLTEHVTVNGESFEVIFDVYKMM